MSVDKSGNSLEYPKSVAAFLRHGIEHTPTYTETKSMLAMNLNRTAGELLPISRAAARVGLSDRVMTRAVETGSIPVVVVGDRRWINSKALADWARGTLLGTGSPEQEQ